MVVIACLDREMFCLVKRKYIKRRRETYDTRENFNGLSIH